MRYDPTDRTLTLEPTDCGNCRHQRVPGTMPSKVPCPTCHGTGNGVRGGKRACRGGCYGFGTTWDHDNRIPCPACHGDYAGHDLEIFTDRAPTEAVMDLPLTIVREDRRATWNEQYLGMGTVWSTIDYGRAWDGTDDELRASITERLPVEWVQACKIIQPCDRDATTAHLVPGLTVLLTRDGYSVRVSAA